MTVRTLTVVVLLAAAPARAQERLTFGQAIESALARGREVQAAEQGVEASRARVSGATARRWPSLHADANILYWDKPLRINFGAPDMPGAQAGALTVRDQVTSQVTLTLTQPISGLLAVNRLVRLERNGVEAARADQVRSRLDTAQRVAEAYLRLLQAKALLAVASKTLTQVDGQLAQAKVLERGGVLGAVDVLRLTSARENARGGRLRAETGVTIAAAALAVALDRPAGATIEAVDDLPEPPPPLTVTDRQAVELAGKERPELSASRERILQARAGREVALAQLLPNILAVATYQNTHGQSTFQPINAWFVGATLSWDLWDWGHNWSAVKEAESKANQAALGGAILADQIAFDAQRRLLEAHTAYETIAVARSALEAAEEAHRIQSVRFAGGAATTTDVLDAETDVSRARSGYAQSRYDYYLAQAGLARALGRLPRLDGQFIAGTPGNPGGVPRDNTRIGGTNAR
jgi:outer membrane protein